MGGVDPRASVDVQRARSRWRPVSAAPALKDWRHPPPWQSTASWATVRSTSQDEFLHPPALALVQQRSFKPVQSSAQPIWQTEAINSPFPMTTSASTYLDFGFTKRQSALRPPNNPAPYGGGGHIDVLPRSTSMDAFQYFVLGAARQLPVKPPTNPPPFSRRNR